MLGRAAFAGLVVLLCQGLCVAAEDPLDLARGLREIGQPDLALEYLDELATKKPPADVKVILPLERARCLMELAQLESEEAAREGGIAQAKTAFEKFLAANPKHPRAAEAQLALAQVTAVQAVDEINSTRKISDPDPAAARKKRRAAIIATRPLFVKASNLFGDAAKGIATQLASATDDKRKSELQKTIYQAELDRAINQYRLVDTYPSDVQGEEVIKRGAELDKARNMFNALGKKDETSPICWQARAWAGMCEYDKSDRAAAEKIFAQVKRDGSKNPAGADGVRMVNFFEAQIKFLDAVNAQDKRAVSEARGLARYWLDRDRYRSRMTPQRLSMTFYYAYLTEMLGQSEINWEKQSKEDKDANKPQKIRSVSSQGLAYLKEATREYKKLIEFDNEYSERATENRNRATRFIVGDTPKEAKFYANLEEAQMASIVQLMKANEARAAARQVDEADKAKYEAAQKTEREEFAKAIALMKRAKELVTPNTPPREVAETKFNHAIAYYTSGQFPLAAVAGDALAHSARGSLAARGGFLGVDSYLRARDRQSVNADEASRATDQNRAIALAMYLDKTFPTDPSTDSARLRIAQVFSGERQYRKAFDLLSRISPSYADVAAARAIQGRVAFMLIAARDSTLSDAEKAAVFKQAVADCEAVTQPAAGRGLKAYFAVRNLLANLHLSDSPRGYPVAEKIATENIKNIAASTLDDTDKKALTYSSDEVRLRAIYGQAAKQFEDGKYKEMADRLAPSLAAINTAGKAGEGNLEGEAGSAAVSLDKFRREFVLLAMKGRIREGEFDKAAGLFELLDKLGGTIDATSLALNQLVALVRPQVDELRKDKKDAEADKLTNTIGDLLQKQASKDKLPNRVQASLGRSLRDLGQYEKAIEVLKKVPTPTPEKLALPTTTLDEEDRNAVYSFQIAQIEMARAYRALKNFAEADRILKAALGDGKQKGWARSLEFRKEAVLLLEDKAANMPADQQANRGRAWVEAKKAWEAIALQYAGAIRNKDLNPNDREKLVPIYLDILCDLRRCIARGNSQLISDPAKLNESLTKIGGQVHDIEVSNPTALKQDVKDRYRELLNDYPAIKAEYKRLGGKAFLDESAGN